MTVTSRSRARPPPPSSAARLDDLVAYLGRAMDFPDGVLLMTGTGIVPEASFSLQSGDVVEIDGGPLGVLRNATRRV